MECFKFHDDCLSPEKSNRMIKDEYIDKGSIL